MMLNKRERNKIYESILTYSLDPREFALEDVGNAVTISHNSGAIFEFSQKSKIHALAPSLFEEKYEVKAYVPEGLNESSTVLNFDFVMIYITSWLEAIWLTVGVPDYWAEIRRSRELITDIQQTDSDNTPFTEDEQRQIAAKLQEIKEQLKEQYELTNGQIEQIEEKLDEAAEASESCLALL